LEELIGTEGTAIKTGTSTPYKRWSKCSMEKVRGKVFAAFFGKLRGEAKFINCSINFLCNYHLILQVDNVKIFNLQRKLMDFPAPPSFCKIPPNLIMY